MLFLAGQALAELVVGRVVDSMGQGIAGVDIDVNNEHGGGGDPDIFNDGTNADGFFSMTVTPFGVFDIEFNAPPPGATTSLSVTLTDVLVAGTVDLGTIVLPPGVALSGRVLDVEDLPVANVNIDIFDETSNSRLVTPFDRTDLFGNFLVGVPAGPIEVRLDATTVQTVTLASQRIQISPTSDTDLGDITLPPGITVFGGVQSGLGLPIVSADLDFTDTATTEGIYTPHDNTDTFGNFSVVVPAGTYDVQICPVPGDLFVSVEIDGLPAAIDTNLGLISLQPGFLLSGVLTHSNGRPAAGADINIDDSVTGATVALCRDDTNGVGFYSVIVPVGTFDITFTQRCTGTSVRRTLLADVLVTGNQTLNATLPPGPCGKSRQNSPAGSVSMPAF